jgi:hypothetical protein
LQVTLIECDDWFPKQLVAVPKALHRP